MKNEWKNATSFSPIDKIRTQNIWALDTGNIKITLVRNHRNNPGVWVLHCYNLDIEDHDTHLLNTESPEVAQDYAIRFIKIKLANMLKSLEE